jgi:hypothetical protein
MPPTTKQAGLATINGSFHPYDQSKPNQVRLEPICYPTPSIFYFYFIGYTNTVSLLHTASENI